MNKVVLMGRLTAAPELRTTPNGISVTTFTVAVAREFRQQNGERQADFIDIVAWRNTAEFVTKYFTKGQLIALVGSMQTRTYVDKNGNNRKAVEVVADSVYFTGDRRDADHTASNNSYSPDSSSMPSYSNGSASDFEDMPSDDDLPF